MSNSVALLDIFQIYLFKPDSSEQFCVKYNYATELRYLKVRRLGNITKCLDCTIKCVQRNNAGIF